MTDYTSEDYIEYRMNRAKETNNDFFDFDEETVHRLYPLSQRFVEEIDKILRK